MRFRKGGSSPSLDSGFAMAQCILFGKDLTLGLPEGGAQYNSDPNADLGSPITSNIVAVDDHIYAWKHCTQAQIGKKDHKAELVDYLGVLPVLETGVTTSTPSTQSYKSRAMVNIPESSSAQLTMFYAGTVNVFDNVIADKAQSVLSFAEKNTAMKAIIPSFKMPMPSPIRPYGPQLQDLMKGMQPQMEEEHSMAEHFSDGKRFSVTKDDHESATFLVPCQAMVPTVLPLARKASLARFLEKRKERAQPVASCLAKGSALKIMHQGGTHQSSASTPETYNKEFFDGPNAKKLRMCALPLTYNDALHVEDHYWLTSVEDSKQVLESESAT